MKETASVEVTVTATGNDTDDGNRTVTVAADLDGTAIGSTDITILDDDTTTPNTPPTVATAIPDQSATVGTAFSYAFPATTFTDAESDPLTYTATKADGTPLPAWLSFNESTRAFSGTPPAAGTVSVKVTASDGAGSVSDTFDITVQPVPTTVPGAPTGLSATASGTSTINLTWDAPSNDGGASISGYRIEVSPNGDSNWTNRVANTGTTSTTYAHTGLSAGDTRHYRVSAINSVGTGDASNVDNATTDDAATTVPGAPTGLSATASGTSTINLTWDAPSNDGGASISGYRIEVSPNGDSNWTNRVANTGTTSTTYAHTGLSAGDTRHYRVSAINSVGTGDASNVDNATTDDAATTVPGAPTGLTATASGTSTINLTWDAPSNDGGASISGYRIEVSPNGDSNWTNRVANTGTTSTTYAHTGLSAGTTRHYRVSAINSVGTGAASSTANATTDDAATTVPGAPTGLTATASGTTTINLSWTAPADNGGAAITGYRIEVSPNRGTNWSNRVANTGTTTTTYSQTGLFAGTTRHYRVSAINALGSTGAASNVANATTDDAAPTVPGAPTGLSATADGTSTIDLDWTAPTDNGGSDVTGYRIEVSSNGSSGWSNLEANTNSTSTTYAHTGLSAGDTRHYRVSAINSVGTGDASSTANATTDDAAPTVPGAPTGLSATADGTSTIDLDWTAPSDDGGASITGYRIEVSSNGSSGWSNLEANTNSTPTTYAHTGLSAGDTRHYRVSAINSVGTGTASNTANATTATTVPGAPTSLTATASGTTTINLDWTAPTDNGGSDITGYRIEVSSNGSSGWSNREANTNSTTTTYAHTGLSAGDTRHYRVSAINSVGTGDASSTANATTDDAATTVPGAPTGLSATADGTSTIDLSWTAPTDNGGSDITGYRIEVSPNGDSNWTNREANTNSTSTTYAHTGLSAGDTRHYRVSAINSVGTGDASNVDNATTDDAATTVPGAPTGLSATADGTSTIDLSWTAPTDNGGSAITGYRIEVSPNGDSNWTNRVANTGTTSTTYAHTGLSAGDTRHYRVSAINSVGTGDASNVDNATTDDAARPTPTPTAPAPPCPRPFSAGDTRHYRVSAINSVGTGDASSTANATTDDAATTVPGAPTGLSATADGTSTIDLDWTAPTDNGGSDITGYRIEVSSNGRLVQPRGQHQQHQHRPHRPFRRHHPPSSRRPPPTTPPPPCPAPRPASRQLLAQWHLGPPTPTGFAQWRPLDPSDESTPAHRSAITGYRIEGSPNGRLELDQPRRQHRHHLHHLLPHRPFRRHHPPLPRLGHQLGRHRRRLQHRRRHHRRGRRAGAGGGDRARAGAIGVGGGHRPFRAAAQRRRHGLAQGQLPARRVVRRQLREVVGLLQAGRHAERGGLRRRAVARYGDGARHGAFESAVHRGQRSE